MLAFGPARGMAQFYLDRRPRAERGLDQPRRPARRPDRGGAEVGLRHGLLPSGIAAHDEDGVYRDSTYDFGGTDGLPNVHAAVTCLVGEAMLAAMSMCRCSSRPSGALGGPPNKAWKRSLVMRRPAAY